VIDAPATGPSQVSVPEWGNSPLGHKGYGLLCPFLSGVYGSRMHMYIERSEGHEVSRWWQVPNLVCGPSAGQTVPPVEGRLGSCVEPECPRPFTPEHSLAGPVSRGSRVAEH